MTDYKLSDIVKARLRQPAEWDYEGITVCYYHPRHFWDKTHTRFVHMVAPDGYPGIQLDDGTKTYRYNTIITEYDKGATAGHILLHLERRFYWNLRGLMTAVHDLSHVNMSDCIDQELLDDLHPSVQSICNKACERVEEHLSVLYKALAI